VSNIKSACTSLKHVTADKVHLPVHECDVCSMNSLPVLKGVSWHGHLDDG
jgi:hypothetical protein